MLFKFFKNPKNKPIVYYSCVIDDNPKFYWQGYIFVNVLIHLAKVAGDRIFVHLTQQNIQFENFLKENRVNVKYIEPWGDKKYCNKLQQLETKELQAADFVFFCDADIAITEDLVAVVVENPHKVLGKIVDFANPDIDKLKYIYDIFNIQYPKISTDTLDNIETFEGNFNGGLYGIPTKYISQFGVAWKNFANEMLNSEPIKNILAEKVHHIDQVSFSLALNKLDLPYKILGFEYNCPTHIKNIALLNSKIIKKAKVIHYHSNVSATGLLNTIENPYIKGAIENINGVIKQNFNNALFWSYRYATNPSLGSGVGSRGGIAQLKLKMLKNIGLGKESSVLDVGCGDLEIVKNISFQAYTGVDISAEAVSRGKINFPNFNFFNFETEKSEIKNAYTVLCLDVLIHQPNKKNYDEVIKFITEKAIGRVVVSGYEKKSDSSHMCFFYEDIKQTLERTGIFKYVYKIAEYRDLGVYVADKGDLLETKAKNDICNDTVDEALKIKNINKDLLLETITFSRSVFGWYTKHYPRLYEYPWLLEKLGRDLENKKIADFGAGVTPLPLQLAQRGAKVFTVDKHELIRDIKQVHNANEWGYFDYNAIDSSIKSHNNALEKNTFDKNSLDVWYSISVVEHMPAIIRRSIFNIMADTLKNGGLLFLTIDLIKDSHQLWNMSEGKIVDNEKEHGCLDSFIQELKFLGFEINEAQVYQMPKNERVDLAMISCVLRK